MVKRITGKRGFFVVLVDTNTGLVALIGNPVGHSLGPIMHNAAFRHLGLNFVYLAFNVTKLKVVIEAMREFGFKGYSVTIPHKENIIPYLDRLEPLAAKIGAVNTVVNKKGLIVGYNTDAIAAVRALKKKVSLKGKRVALLGAGGAARAIAFALHGEKASVTIFNRTFENAKRLAKAVGCDYLPFEEITNFKGEVLVNATPVGMFPKTNASPMHKRALKNFQIVFDIVYNPLETLLLKHAKEMGCETIPGVEMFVEQGYQQFSLWTSRRAPFEVMRKAVLGALEK